MNEVSTEVAISRAVVRDLGEAMTYLAGVFHDRVPRLVGETARTRFFELVPVHAARPPTDPDLIRVARELLGLAPDEIANWRRIEDDPATGRRFAVMLEHTHALEAWCGAALLRPTESPTLLLHIDAHDDLNSPSLLLGADGRTYFAPIGPGFMILDDPKTVRKFATCGYIGIGGFIAPMIGASALNAVLHVTGPRDIGGVSEASLALCAAPDTGLTRVEKRSLAEQGVPYRRMSLHQALDAADHFCGRILLDIDLDAFCNRYDSYGGDDVSDTEALDALAKTVKMLKQSGLLKQAVVTTIALSPGFFPGSLWRDALCFIDDLRSECFGQGVV